MIIIEGPAGSGTARSPGEVRAQLGRQRQKREAVLKTAMRAVVEDLGKAGRTIIIDRTRAGQDYRRRRFGPYTERYAKQKGTNPSHVTLTDSGGFLDSLRMKRANGGMRVIVEFDHRYHRRAHGLAAGRWPVYGKWTAMRRPKRRAMGFDNTPDQIKLQRVGLRAFQREMRRGLRYR